MNHPKVHVSKSPAVDTPKSWANQWERVRKQRNRLESEVQRLLRIITELSTGENATLTEELVSLREENRRLRSGDKSHE